MTPSSAIHGNRREKKTPPNTPPAHQAWLGRVAMRIATRNMASAGKARKASPYGGKARTRTSPARPASSVDRTSQIVGGSVPTVNADLDLALECARRAAVIVRDGFTSDVAAEFKGSVDPVTKTDRAAEAAIRHLLANERPADAILGEEGGGEGWHTGRVWIVDPLDGTVNFIHRLAQVSVSVALWEDGRPVVGVVHDAIRDEVFAAAAGEGATVDGRSISVSRLGDIGGALVATGFPYDRRERASELVETLGRVLSRVQGIRRIGSAALDLCYVGAGRFDAYWEYRLQPWDTAAGQLIVTEAGGTVTDLTGLEYRPDAPGLLASNGIVHAELLSVIGS